MQDLKTSRNKRRRWRVLPPNRALNFACETANQILPAKLRIRFYQQAARWISHARPRVRIHLQGPASDSQPERNADDVHVEIAIDVPEKERARIEQHALGNQPLLAEVADDRTLEPIEDAQKRALDD